MRRQELNRMANIAVLRKCIGILFSMTYVGRLFSEEACRFVLGKYLG